MTARIEDYAMIGDCRTAAIICRNGSIDWLCVPRFDSEAIFAALLGTRDNGRWLMEPATKNFKTSRRYRGDSLILETTFTTPTGKARVSDFMPPGTPESAVVRIVEALEGHVDMRTELAIRFDYGVTIPWVSRRDTRTMVAVAGPHLLTFRTRAEVRGEDMHSVSDFTVKKGAAYSFVLTYGQSFGALPQSLDPFIAREETERYWQRWSAVCKAKGKWRNAIMRSLITLKGLSYAPTGGIVAAATTSLPEKIGSTRNWDYRYCWLRDATFTLLAFLNAGYTEEARVWQEWLMRVVAGAPDQLQTMYNVLGEKRLDEIELPLLPGYENSRPVRIGNAAHTQLQLDIFGEMADVGAQSRAGGLKGTSRGKELRAVFMAHLEKIWCLPDEGIWEIRGQARHFVYSKVMTWVAFDRASCAPDSTPQQKAHWKKMARQIHADVCKKGVDKKLGCFVQYYGAQAMDASLLLLSLVGFLPPSDPRIKKTVREIEKRLIHKGLVHRYETTTGVDGLPPGEGAFLACSFWLADNYTLMGRRKDGLRLFNRLRRLANDVGLYAEEYDADARRMLGNFPQAFSHVALINTALNLMMTEKKVHEKKIQRSRRGRRP
jgi:GH15 family glucan-1,4-alpha-glucosidase